MVVLAVPRFQRPQRQQETPAPARHAAASNARPCATDSTCSASASANASRRRARWPAATWATSVPPPSAPSAAGTRQRWGPAAGPHTSPGRTRVEARESARLSISKNAAGSAIAGSRLEPAAQRGARSPPAAAGRPSPPSRPAAARTGPLLGRQREAEHDAGRVIPPVARQQEPVGAHRRAEQFLGIWPSSSARAAPPVLRTARPSAAPADRARARSLRANAAQSRRMTASRQTSAPAW